MASYHWRIATDQNGSNAWTFVVNPLDIAGMKPERAYTVLQVLDSSPLLQFPTVDTRLREVSFDTMTDDNLSHVNFLFGESESDTDSILYLSKFDSDGKLTTYWLHIPQERVRPYGYRDVEWFPIRVEEVRIRAETVAGTPRWVGALRFRIVPWAEAQATFKLDWSPLDSAHTLITDHLGKVYVYDASAGTFTDVTTAAYTPSSYFPSFTVATGDKLYCACATQFYGLAVDMHVLETVEPDVEQGQTKNSWHYWNGTAWTSYTADDQTAGFTKDSRWVTWSALTGWTAADLSSIETGAPSTDALYWVRMTVGTVTTAWQMDKLLRA